MKRGFLFLMVLVSMLSARSQNNDRNQLPVMFDEVKAYARDNGVQLQWANLTERDLIKYEVQRADTSADYTSISVQLPVSNLDEKASYLFFDAAPQEGTNFYRIKVYVKSGKIIYSKTMKIKIGVDPRKGLAVYPNPVTGGQLTIALTGEKKGKYVVRLVDITGRDRFRTSLSTPGDGMVQVFHLPASITAGIYTLAVTGDDYRERRTLIVQ